MIRPSIRPWVGIARLRYIAALIALMLAGLALPNAHATPITIEWVTVGDSGNAADTTGYGTVNDSFRIMKFEFTNLQYTNFLNVVAATDPYSLYNTTMGSNVRGGITRSGSSGSFTYSVKPNMGDKPVNYVSWFDAARVANWLQNGQGSGSTETGAYTLSGAEPGVAVAVNPGALYFLPTENQWYKAAYYNPALNNGAGGYHVYGNGFDDAPGLVSANEFGVGSAGDTGNFANYGSGAIWNSQTGNVTTVGTNGGASAYGAFDMSGNVFEWNDLDGLAASGSARGLRGGDWTSAASNLSSSDRLTFGPFFQPNTIGFRLASPVAVPEPSTWVMGLAGIACGGWQVYRRRRKRA